MAYVFKVKPAPINTGTVARSFFPIIQAKCQVQIDNLTKAGDRLSLDKAKEITLAVARLDKIITLKEKISQPDVTHIQQENGEEDIQRLFREDFSNLKTVLSFQSEIWSWNPARRNAVVDFNDEYSNNPRGDKSHTFHSVQDALNISFYNPFNGLFWRKAYYGPLWGSTAMFLEVKKEISDALTGSSPISGMRHT